MSVLNNKQFFVLLGVGALGVYVISRKASDVADALNPVSQDNIFNQAANELGEAITGNPNATGSFFDHIYGGLDLLNPWAPDNRKQYAKQVWGLK